MPRNSIEDLRNHLFETIERLKDDESPMDLARAREIAHVAQVLVDSAKVEAQYLKVTGGLGGTSFIPDGDVPAPRRQLTAGKTERPS